MTFPRSSNRLCDIADESGILCALDHLDYCLAVSLCVRVYGFAVWRFCEGFVGNRADGEDLSQETFIHAHAAFRNSRCIGNVLAYLLGISKHICSSHLRTEHRHAELLVLSRMDKTYPADAFELFACFEEAQLAKQAVVALDFAERQVVELSVWKGLTYSDIGYEVGVDEPTARKRYSRALQRLRAKVDS